MTPKEKAISLVQSFIDEGFLPAAARIAALIAVDEILKIACPDTFACKSYTGDFYSDEEYFIKVKKELEVL